MQSLTQLPTRHQRALAAFLERMRGALGDNLHCLAVYGSAVRGAFDPRRSDVNVLLVLEASTVEAHGEIGDAIAASGVTIAPFIVDRALLPRAARAFAVKFASIKRAHRVLHGVDVLEAMQVDAEIARFLVEQALLNARLRAVQAYVRSRGGKSRYGEFVVSLVPQLVTEMSELLRLEGNVLAEDWQDRVPALSLAYELPEESLRQLLGARAVPPGQGRLQVVALHRLLLLVLDAAVARSARDALPAGAQPPTGTPA